MMKKLFVGIVSGAALFSFAGEVLEWKLNDGTGATKIRETRNPELAGNILSANKLQWSQADNRGFFATLSGASIKVPHSEKLLYPDGFVLDTEFSCNFEAAPKQQWFGLISKGQSYSSGYAVMIHRNGTVLVSLKLDKGSVWFQCRAKLKSSKNYKMTVGAGDGKVRVWIDGKLVGATPFKGKIADLGEPFFIGAGYYPFFGNIYHVRLMPYRAAALPQGSVSPAVRRFAPVPARPDPAGTVIVNDFFRFTPQPLDVTTRAASDWCFRTNMKLSQSRGILYPPSIDVGELEYDPMLRGKYDVHVIGRIVFHEALLQFRLGDDSKYYKVFLPKEDHLHHDVEIRVVSGVDMTGKKIRIAPGHYFYLGCFKFLPAGNNPAPALEEGCRVEYGPLAADESTQKEIRKKIASGYFTERHYIEAKKEPLPQAESQKRGYIVFPWNPLRHLFPNSVPAVDPGLPSLKASAAPGEFEPLTFGVRGLRDAGTLQMKVTGLPKNVSASIAVIESVPRRTTNYQGHSEFMVAPAYLENTDTLTLHRGESRQFWLTLRAAPNAQPGTVNGIIELINSGNTTKLPFSFTIRPFSLDPVKGYDIGFDAGAWGREGIRKGISDMADHGMNSICIHSESLLRYKGNTAETIEIDFSRSKIVELADACRDFGLTQSINLYADGLAVTALRFPERKNEVYTRLVRQLETERRKRNWPPFTYGSWDEILANINRVGNYIWEVQLLKSLGCTVWGNHIWYKTVTPYDEELAKITPHIDIFIVRFNTRGLYYADSWETIQSTVKARKKRLMDYSPHAALMFAQMAAMRFNGGWFFRTIGTADTGKFFYSYNEFYGSPYNDLDGIDWIYKLPPMKGRCGGFSLDYECYREGIDDLRYIQTLENRIRKAEARKIDVSAEKALLTSLAAGFDVKDFFSNSLFTTCHWTKTWEKDGKRYAAGDFNLPGGWTLEFYDTAREKIAAAITNIDKKMR